MKRYWEDPEHTQSLLNQASQYAHQYLSELNDRRVFPSIEALEQLATFDEPLPDKPSDPKDVLEHLHRSGSPATLAQTSGRYFGFVNGGILPIGLATRWLSDTWDQNTAHYVMSPINAQLEDVCEKWLVELFDFHQGTAAGFVTGTTLANFSGMCAGRNEILRRMGWDAYAKGLYGAPRIRIFVGAGAHAAVHKSAAMLGMGTESVEVLPMDDHGRFIPESIPDLDQPSLIVAQAGNVNSGAIDPVGEICDVAAKSNSWVHVDGAFGLWARAVPRLASSCLGFEKADSWAVDAHKTLNVPYDSGIILCKDRRALASAFQSSATYFQWSEERDPMQLTPSMSKRARAVELWAVLKSLGRQGVIELVERLCTNARQFAEQLQANGFTILNDVNFNQVLVGCGDDAITEKTIEHIQSAGECWCGGSKWQGQTVIRISVCDWATTNKEVDRSVAAIMAARSKAETEI